MIFEVFTSYRFTKKENAISKPIHQTITFKASPHDVYEALMDSKKHAAFTGGKASISHAVGGEIMAYDNYITDSTAKTIETQRSQRSTKENLHIYRRVLCVLRV